MDESNTEAIKAFDIAQQHEDKGNYEKALKFYQTSHRLHSKQEVEICIERVKSKLKKNETPINSQTKIEKENTEEKPSTPSYTKEQEDEVKRVLNCKNYYESILFMF